MESMADVVDLPRLASILDRLTGWVMRDVLSLESLAQVVLIGIAFVGGRAAAYLLCPALDRWASRVTMGRILIERLRDLLTPLVTLIILWLALGLLTAKGHSALTPLLNVAASLLMAWVAINLATTVVRNPFIARLIALAAWTMAALDITGLLAPTTAILDSAALTMGGSRISVLTLVKGAVLAVLLVWLASAGVTVVERRLYHTTGLSPAAQVLIGKVTRFALVTLALLMAIQAAGFDLTGLALLTGAIGVGIGFGLQRPVSNLISGVVMLLDGSIKPGDVIELERENTFGWVSAMGARAVSLVTRDNKEVLVPNEDFITQRAVNWSHSAPEVRLEVQFTVTYAADPHRVREIAVAAAQAADRVLAEPQSVCHLMAFADSGLQFRLRFWINDPTRGVANVTGQVLLKIWDAFQAEGIAFPYPHRQVVVDRPIPVRMAGDGD